MDIDFLYRFIGRRTIVCHIVKKQGNTYHTIKKKRILLKRQSFNYGKNLYIVNLDKCITERNTPHIFYDIDNKSPITIGTYEKDSVDTELVKKIVKNAVYKEIFSGGYDSNFIIIIIVLIVAIGLVSGYALYNQNVINQQLVKMLGGR